MKFILDTRLSNYHYVVCVQAIEENVIDADDLNEGKRTMAEQQWFWDHQPPLAAFPSPTAPHIKKGHVNHAIDCDSDRADNLAAFYRRHGVPAVFNVPGETWHIDFPDEAALKRAAKRIRERDDAVLELHERDHRVKLVKRQLYVIRDPDTGRRYYPVPRPEGGRDNFFNRELQEAVKRFQRDQKMIADGDVGPRTRRRLRREYREALHDSRRGDR